MTHMLLFYHPRFIELDEPWVRLLLKAEMEERGKNGRSCLAYLFFSPHFLDLDLNCKEF